MRIHTIEPEWNAKKFCDNGKGYDPSPINAPSIDYSGSNIQDASYNYQWEQKINSDVWKVVSSAEGKTFIPSFNPLLLRPESNDGQPLTYSWRLKIRDVANGVTVISEVYSLTLAQTPKASHVFSPVKDKYSIDLSVIGGYPGKKFTWTSNTASGSLDDSQRSSEDLKNVNAGSYSVTIQDNICTAIKHAVILSAKEAD